MAEGPNPKKKHLLHRLVKKVLIHSRKTVEIWYVLPNSQRFANRNIWLPSCNSIRSRPGWVEPEVYFRVVHIAQNAHSGAPVAAYREQRVDIALSGPRVPFKTATQEFRTDEKAAGTQAPAAVVTPSLAPRGRGLHLSQGQGL